MTQCTEPNAESDMYTASFELYPFYEGLTFSFYKGLLDGKGPLRGQFCVVRAMLDRAGYATDWEHVLKRATYAQLLAVEFNRHVGYSAVNFQRPMLTQVETVSDFTCVFRCFVPHDKRLQREEYVTLEPFIDGKFRRFDFRPAISSLALPNHDAEDNDEGVVVNDDGKDNASDNIPDASEEKAFNMAAAFSHFTWQTTKSILVCDLQGFFSGLSFTLTNPRIHSIKGEFGVMDGGMRGIAEFFSTHRCNSVCSKWEPFSSPRHVPTKVNFYHMPQPPSSYYNCNPAEPSAPLRFENGYEFSAV